MEENNSSGSNSNSSSCIPTQHLYTHLVPTPPNSSSAHYMMTHMPFPSYYLSPAAGDDGRGFPPSAGTSGFGPGGLVHGEEGPPAELDFDSNDGESEEGIGALEEPPKPPTNRGSGSKRSRAAEVHNLSEKRRRSRINEKMKALQNLIPNSNKTDKASMLDEAIEYLKQLQLQVQMLSMRNGLNLQSMYMPGALQALQSSQLCLGFGVDNGSAVNTSVGLLPLNLESSARNSYTFSDRVASSHESMIPTGVRNMPAPVTSFMMELSHAQHGSFQLPVSSELCTENAVQQEQVDSGRSTAHVLGNDMGSMGLASTVQFRRQTSSMEDANRGILRGDSSEDMLSKDTANRIFIQHFHGLQTGSSFPADDVKRE